ncbi:MAG: hypothetical protein J6C41_01875 [Oscillospiraceae bacterium]|nr:hypothetical protein [Oscillospiraceae bacterium]
MYKLRRLFALIVALSCVLIICVGCNEKSKTLQNDESVSPQAGLQLDDAFKPNTDNPVFATYDWGYDNIEDVVQDADVIVRARPVGKEVDSAVASCWILQVEQSNIEGVTTVKLRQVKDEYYLREEEEVVLALQEQEDDPGYYYVQGGGYGLFRINTEDNVMEGLLLEQLLTDYENATLTDVYEALIALK